MHNPHSGRILLAIASDTEAQALRGRFPGFGAVVSWKPVPLAPGVDLVITGVGKANAAGAVAFAVANASYAGVLSAGFAGTLPGSELGIGDPAVIRHAMLADEGVQTEAAFIDLVELGFPPVAGADPRFGSEVHFRERLASIGPACDIATVSTCSGTDQGAARIASRTGAWLEDMETAAVAIACLRLGIPWCGVRVVSNTTGDRSRQVWDISRAIEVLGDVIGRSLASITSTGV